MAAMTLDVATGAPAPSTTAVTESRETYPLRQQSFPEGGRQAWLVVFGSWCAMISAFGLMNSIGVFEDWLASYQLQEDSHASVSWIFSVHIFFLMFGGVIVGPLFDSYGPRYLLLAGSLGIVTSLMIFSLSQDYYQFMLSFGVLGGISASLLFTPSLGSVNHWFFRRRALATAIATTAGSIGGVIFPLIFGRLAPTIGFSWAIRTLGFISLGLCTGGVMLQKARLTPRKAGPKLIDPRVLREVPFALATLAIVLADIGATIPLVYLTSYARANQVPSALSYQLMAIFNAASILGRLIPGYAADVCGRFNVMIVTAAVCSTLALGLWLNAKANWKAVVSFAALFGFWSGSVISLSPVCIAQISRTEDIGKRLGTTYTLAALMLLVSNPAAGEIVKAQSTNGGSNYSGLILFCGLSYVASLVFFVLTRGVCTGWKIKQAF